MPPRLNKRQQREQEELEALSGPSKIQGAEDVSEDDLDMYIGKRNGATSTVIDFTAVG